MSFHLVAGVILVIYLIGIFMTLEEEKTLKAVPCEVPKNEGINSPAIIYNDEYLKSAMKINDGIGYYSCVALNIFHFDIAYKYQNMFTPEGLERTSCWGSKSISIEGKIIEGTRNFLTSEQTKDRRLNMLLLAHEMTLSGDM